MADLTPRMPAHEYLAMMRAGGRAPAAAGATRAAVRRSAGTPGKCEDVPASRERKYGNRTVCGVDGVRFDSAKEARQMQVLDLARSAGLEHERVVDVRC